MPQGIWKTLGVLLLLGGPAAAQHALHCRDLDPLAPQDAIRAFECVSKLDADLTDALTRLAELERSFSRLSASVTQANGVPALGDHENTRAIVAYYSDKGEKRCPSGWSPFEEAKERFIVGASAEGKYPVVGRTGGEETVTLTEAQMPSHSHRITSPEGSPLRFQKYVFGGTGDGAQLLHKNGPDVVDYYIAEEVGGSQPHNNIPPYIALYFCKKD